MIPADEQGADFPPSVFFVEEKDGQDSFATLGIGVWTLSIAKRVAQIPLISDDTKAEIIDIM